MNDAVCLYSVKTVSGDGVNVVWLSGCGAQIVYHYAPTVPELAVARRLPDRTCDFCKLPITYGDDQ